MNKNQPEVLLKFKNKSNVVKNDKLNDDTLKNIINDINILYKRINLSKTKIIKCNSEEELNKIDISSISNDIGLIIQNAILINEQDLKRNIEELNQSYRNLEIIYFNKKIDILSYTINKTAIESEQNLKDITGGTLFSIASVFLGISLTSALVAGVQAINSHFIILYFMTCLLITVITIGTAAIFMRKFDVKSIVISSIIIIVTVLWGMTSIFTYNNYNIDDETKQGNVITTQDSNNVDYEKTGQEEQNIY